MVVSNNLMAMNANRMLGINDKKKASYTEKLSSGYRINRAADDAAGLAISEKMRRQIRGLNQATSNVQDGVSFSQVADGALNEVHDMLNRMNELAVKAANGTLTDDDRNMINEEVSQLKQELKRTFKTTEFNEIKIFQQGYTPEVEGNPDDFQVFMTSKDGYGGIAVNNIRYTWSEMGIEFNSDGSYKKDYTYETTSPDSGESIEISVKAGEKPPVLYRNYDWQAKNDGIYVNDILAATWNEMGIDTSNVHAGEYSFEYHGMTISFETDKWDDSLSDLIEGINGDKATKSHATWSSVYSYSNVEKAVDILENSQKFSICSNADLQTYLASGMKIVADDDSIGIVTDSFSGYTDTVYSSIKDTNYVSQAAADTYSGVTNGGYPIVDWGLIDNGNTSDTVTFDDEATYNYTDAKTGFSVDFKIADEASLSEFKNGMSTGIARSVSSTRVIDPIPAITDTTGSGNLQMNISMPNFSIRMQEILGRDFSDTNQSIASNVTMSDNGDGTYKVQLSLGNNTQIKYSANVSVNDLRSGNLNLDLVAEKSVSELNNMISDGLEDSLVKVKESDRHISLSVSGITPYDQYADDRHTADNYTDTWIDYAKDINGNIIKDTNGNPITYQHQEMCRQLLYPDNVPPTDITEDVHYLSYLDDFVKNITDFVDGQQPQVNATNSLSVTMTASENWTSSKSAVFDIKVNPPEKELDIQAGTEAGQHIEMRWSPLSLSILGIGGLTTLTQESAGGAINSIKEAMKVISWERTTFGAYQNRMEHTINNLRNVSENTQASESEIRDTDMAEYTVKFSNSNIISQAGQAMLANANTLNEGVLRLLQ